MATEKISEMSIEAFVERYSVFRQDDKIGSYHFPAAQRADCMAYAKEHKPEIMQYLLDKEAEKKRAAEERQSKIDAIPGLKELRAARADAAAWRDEWTANIERGDSGVGLRPRPQYDFKAMEAKYPRAVAYLKAEAMSYAAHYVKAGAGRDALERIINGEDGTQALADAEKEFSDYCHEHIWD